MKAVNIFVILTAAAVSVSCLNSVGFESKFQANVTLDEFTDTSEGDIFEGGKVCLDRSFLSQSILLCNKASEDNTYDFGGFALSKATSKDELEVQDERYAVNCESAASGTVFAVFHNNPDVELGQHIIFYDYQYQMSTCLPVSCMVNNTKTVAESIKKYNETHDTPLEVKLTATGYTASGTETGSADILLAGPGKTGEARDSIVSSWTVFELKKLGDIDYIKFDIEFSDQVSIPELFCMDNFVADVYIKSDDE